MIKQFSPVRESAEDNWKHTQTILRLITQASAKTLKKLREDPPTPIRLKLDGAEVVSAIFDGSDSRGLDFGEEFYLTQIDLWNRQYTCDCKKFLHSPRTEPCKHVLAALVSTLKAKEFKTDSTADIIDRAAVQDRFLGGHRTPWEWNPSFDHDIASFYHFRVERTFMQNRTVTCYREMVRDQDGKSRPGKAWRGPLPLPEPGDVLAVRLPQAEGPWQVEVMERQDSDTFIGFSCRFIDGVPESYSSPIVTVYGADITRTKFEIERKLAP